MEITNKQACSSRCGERACDCREAHFEQLQTELAVMEEAYGSCFNDGQARQLEKQDKQIEQLEAENEKLKALVIQSRMPPYCTGKGCGCAEKYMAKVEKDKIRLKNELEAELKQALDCEPNPQAEVKK